MLPPLPVILHLLAIFGSLPLANCLWLPRFKVPSFAHDGSAPIRRSGSEAVTITPVPSTQSKTDTVLNTAITTGSIITTLATEGRPPIQPFPTSVAGTEGPVLQPANTTISHLEGTTYAPPLSITATITLPLSTVETVVGSQTVASVPIQTVISVTSVVVEQTTFTANGTVLVSSTVHPTAGLSTATVLSETTLVVSITVTNTVSTVVSGGMLSSTTAAPSGRCTFSIKCGAENLFEPIALGPPPSNIPKVPGHPVPRKGIYGMDGPIPTNKFYFNFFLGSQAFPVFVTPYSLSWSKGGGNARSWGMAISHVDDEQKVFGPNNDKIKGSPAAYYINPLGIQSIILSAAEIGPSAVLTTDSLEHMSGIVNLSPTNGAPPKLRIPMVQGMAFISAIYEAAQLEIQTSVFYRSIVSLGQVKDGIFKYKLTLEDGKIWLLYAAPSYSVDPNLKLTSSTMLQGIPSWSGLIQVTKLPPGADEKTFDNASGAYPSSGTVGGQATVNSAEYSLSWTKAGPYAGNTTLLMYALPHHMASFDETTISNAMSNIKLQTTTKGTAVAVLADCWVMKEQLNPSMGFAPWSPQLKTTNTLSRSVMELIQNVSISEASQDMKGASNLNSMYFSGKALSKYAKIVYTMNDLANQPKLASAALTKLKAAFATFAENRQEFPLYYDTDWKGLVSSASYVTGDPGVDFGNSYYNDHHFHYAYFIHAAALIGYLDPTWVSANKDYVNALIRDVANPTTLDAHFPLFRAFDWYSAHSWAKGLFETGDGKDEESTSEDALFAYALKMWGRTVGDLSMELRGDLMLSMLARSIQSYFLMESDNKNQPARFIGNKVTGILFENKADHVTYFGANPEYIQGIQMVPCLPFSALTRTRRFVQEEWETYFGDGAFNSAQNVQGGWKGILFGNLAIINCKAAFNFFSQDNFDWSWLDGGASLTWYLAYTAGLCGAT